MKIPMSVVARRLVAWDRPARDVAAGGRAEARLDGADDLQHGAAGGDSAGDVPPRSRGQGLGLWRNVPGYAMVRQEREMSIDAKSATLRFSDVAALIDPTTVKFVSLTDPGGTRVLEQSYQFDLVSTEKLMERYLDRDITVQQVNGNQVKAFSGKLLSTSGGLVLQTPDKGRAGLERLRQRAAAGAAAGPDHAADARVGGRHRQARAAARARHLSDQRHHLVGGLQSRLRRGEGRQPRHPRRRRLGEHSEPVGRQLRRRQAQAHRRQRPPRRATRRRVGHGAQGDDGDRRPRRASKRSRSSSTTSTRWAVRRRCPTTRPSRSSCSRRCATCRRRRCWSTTDWRIAFPATSPRR